MFNGWHRWHKIGVDPNESPESLFPDIVDGNAALLALTFKGFPLSFKQEIEEEARPYYSTGSCRLPNGMENVCLSNNARPYNLPLASPLSTISI